MTSYPLTSPIPPISLTIHIHSQGNWLPVKLLTVRAGWVVVDNGDGLLWVMMEQVWYYDWPVVAAFVELVARRN